MEETNDYVDSNQFRNSVLDYEEPICPKCGKGRIVCPEGKIKKPHHFHCNNECGWTKI